MANKYKTVEQIVEMTAKKIGADAHRVFEERKANKQIKLMAEFNLGGKTYQVVAPRHNMPIDGQAAQNYASQVRKIIRQKQADPACAAA